MRSRRRYSGTPLLEILVAVAFLTFCAYAILETVITADVQSTYALRRSIVISVLQDQLDAARGLAAAGTLTTAVNSTSLTFSGFVGPVSVTSSSTLRPTSLSLFDVTATATWKEESPLRVYTDTATLCTTVKQ